MRTFSVVRAFDALRIFALRTFASAGALIPVTFASSPTSAVLGATRTSVTVAASRTAVAVTPMRTAVTVTS